jgi:EmrB/QacA subfamily drug resistance transporter
VQTDHLRYRSRAGRGVLAATVLGSGVAFLDMTVVNVALPAIEEGLDAGFAGLQWIVDAYLLTLSGLLLVGGALGDHFGRRRVFVAGLIGFGAASALCGLAPTTGWLIVARALQGVGAALLVPGSLALLRATFAGAERDEAIGAWAGLSGVSTALGPMAGGWLVEAISWRAIFYINIPIVLIAVRIALRSVPESRGERGGGIDLAGALTAVVGLGGVTFGLIEAPRTGPTPLTLTALLVGAGALASFAVLESRCPHPMLPPAIFRSRQFTGANLTTLAVYFALNGTLFLLVIYLQTVMGYSALAAGAAMMPVTLALLLLSPVAGRVAGAVGYRAPMTVGPFVSALGLLMLARIGPASGYWTGVMPGVAVLGIGLGATVAPLTAAVLDGAESRFAGLASGVNNAIARTAGLLAVALLPLASGSAAGGEQVAGSLVHGFPRAMWIAASFAAIGGVVAWLTVQGRRTRAE